ncbi:MAG: hypothetical protein M1812_005870 [Candelaria pacifica]|nr:MAG: hypothetical protein M1812_005870 [Candelaria pacifica]
MSANKDTYREDVDFQALALQFASFAKHLKPNGQLDFSDPEAVQELTKCLLQRDFRLSVELPNDRLCPPVPNRFNYILWVQSLLDTTSESYSDKYDPNRDVIGLDIGTGASCIYPLLGCAQRPRWRFGATDIDDKSLQYARENIARNDFKSRIRLLKTTPEGPLIPLKALGLESIDFTICNPPFYTSSEEMLSSATLKQRPPFSEIARNIPSLPRNLLPFPNTYTFDLSSSPSVTIATNLNILLSSLDLQWQYRPSIAAGIGFATKNVWSRASRRQLKQQKQAIVEDKDRVAKKEEGDEDEDGDQDEDEEMSSEEDKVALGFKIEIHRIRKTEDEDKEGTEVRIRWLKGKESVLFESFCGMVRRKLIG